MVEPQGVAMGGNGDVPSVPPKARSWLGRTLRPMARGSLRGCIFTLMSAAIGPGCLLLPYMFRLVGLPLGLLALSLGGYASAQSLRFIMSLAYLSGKDTYPASVTAVLGHRAGAFLSNITTFILLLGTGGHLKALADVMRSMLPPEARQEAYAQLWAVAAVFPFASRRDISFLRHMAIIAPMGLLYVLCLVLARGLGSSEEDNDAGATSLALLRFGDGGVRNFPRAWSIVVNALTCHHLAVPVYKELHRAKASRVNKVVLRAISSVTLLYALVGTCGFVTHGIETPENFLLVYEQGDLPGLLAKTLLCCALMVSAPLNIHALRGHLLETLPTAVTKPLRGATGLTYLASMAFFAGVPASICAAFPSVTDIVGVCAGFGLVSYMFIIPSAAVCMLRWGGSGPGLAMGDLRSIARSSSRESFQDMLLTSPLSSPLLSPRLGGSMVSSHQNLQELVDEDLQLPEAEGAGEPADSPVFQMQCLSHEDLQLDKTPALRGRRSGSRSPAADRGRSPACRAMWSSGSCRSPSPSPSDGGQSSAVLRWGSEFFLAMGAMVVGSILGFVAASESLSRLLARA